MNSITKIGLAGLVALAACGDDAFHDCTRIEPGTPQTSSLGGSVGILSSSNQSVLPRVGFTENEHALVMFTTEPWNERRVFYIDRGFDGSLDGVVLVYGNERDRFIPTAALHGPLYSHFLADYDRLRRKAAAGYRYDCPSGR